MAIRVLLVDDHKMVIEGLKGLLAIDGAIEVVGEAQTGERGLQLAGQLAPDVMVLDVTMPGLNGIETMKRIRVLAPETEVIGLSMHATGQVICDMLRAGASGYILNTSPPEVVVRAIRDTASGESVLAPQVAGKILQRIRELQISIASSGQSTASEIRAVLTERELQVFAQLATGHTNHQIGAELGLSPNTVSNHIKSILTKLHLHNRIQAAAYAVRAGMS